MFGIACRIYRYRESVAVTNNQFIDFNLFHVKSIEVPYKLLHVLVLVLLSHDAIHREVVGVEDGGLGGRAGDQGGVALVVDGHRVVAVARDLALGGQLHEDLPLRLHLLALVPEGDVGRQCVRGLAAAAVHRRQGVVRGHRFHAHLRAVGEHPRVGRREDLQLVSLALETRLRTVYSLRSRHFGLANRFRHLRAFGGRFMGLPLVDGQQPLLALLKGEVHGGLRQDGSLSHRRFYVLLVAYCPVYGIATAVGRACQLCLWR